MLILCGLVVVASFAVGTGSYSAASVKRDVAVDVVGDEDAYMSLVYPDDTVRLDGSDATKVTAVTVRIDLCIRVNAEESRHGISGRAKRPVGFKTHTFQASSAGFQHRLGCLVARSKRPHP